MLGDIKRPHKFFCVFAWQIMTLTTAILIIMIITKIFKYEQRQQQESAAVAKEDALHKT